MCKDKLLKFHSLTVHVLFQVYEILSRTVYGRKKRAEVGVARLLNEGAYTAAFPLHEVRRDSSTLGRLVKLSYLLTLLTVHFSGPL